MRDDARLQAAIELLDEILRRRRPADDILRAYFRHRRYAGSKDRRAVRDLVYRILRSYHRLRWQGAAAMGRSLAMFHVRDAALFSGAEHAPRSLDEHERAALKKLNQGTPPAWARANLPEWIAEPMRRRFGAEFEPEMEALNRPAPLDIRVNTLKSTREDVARQLRKEGQDVTDTLYSPWGLRLGTPVQLTGHALYREGVIEIQDEGAQLIALATEAQPGQTVVDLAAGAGGKTLALAAMMANCGRLIAADIDRNRLSRAEHRLRRAGVTCAETVAVAAAEDPDDPFWREMAGQADVVLLDAPCSATGILRRQPERSIDLSADKVSQLSGLQARLLRRASRLVAPGGRLIYATCSLLLEENELVYQRFIENCEDFALAVIDLPHMPLATTYLLTPARHGCDGFFIAALKRLGG